MSLFPIATNGSLIWHISQVVKDVDHTSSNFH